MCYNTDTKREEHTSQSKGDFNYDDEVEYQPDVSYR